MDTKIEKLKLKLRISNIGFDFWMKLQNLTDKIGQVAFNRASNIADKNAVELTELLNNYPEDLRKYIQNYIEGVEES
jgi:hypothetical protein